MSTPLPPEWYLEIEGRKSGPYTADQIEGFLKDREILPRHRVFSPRRPDEQINAGEFVSALQLQKQRQAQPSAPPPKPRAFNPPNKPRDMDERTGIIKVETVAKTDPTQHLFDALQAVRDRQTQAKLMNPVDLEWGSLSRTTPARKSQLVLTATLTTLLGVSVWGLNRLLQREPASIERPTNHTEKTTEPIAQRGDPHGSPVGSPQSSGTSPASAKSEPIKPIPHSDQKGLAAQSPSKTPALTRLTPVHPQPVTLPIADRARDRPSENREEDREAKGEPKRIDRDPVEEYERQQRGESSGDGSLGSTPGEAGVGGDPQAQPVDNQQIDPKEIPIE